MRAAFDLTSLQNELRKYPKFKELNKLISRYIAARSFHADIEAALVSLEALRTMGQSDAVTRLAVGQALMTHAVIYYCRAAIEDGNGRFKIGVTKGYSPEQSATHKEVVRLRNKSLAHFDVGEGRYGEKWLTEKAILKVEGDSGTILDVWSRTNYLAQLVGDLSDLCETALVTLAEAAEARQKELTAVFFPLFASDPDLPKLVLAHPFDPLDFYKTESAAEAFWQPNRTFHETFVPKAEDGDLNYVQVGEAVTTHLS